MKKIEKLFFYVLAILIVAYLVDKCIADYKYITERRMAIAHLKDTKPENKKDRDIFLEVSYFDTYTRDSEVATIAIPKDNRELIKPIMPIYYCKSYKTAFHTSKERINWGVFIARTLGLILMLLWIYFETKKFFKR